MADNHVICIRIWIVDLNKMLLWVQEEAKEKNVSASNITRKVCKVVDVHSYDVVRQYMRNYDHMRSHQR